MSKLPLLEKNALLSIYLSKSAIYATLAYAHYDIGRVYKLTDRTRIDYQNDPYTKKEFWDEYFIALESKFGWDFIEKNTNQLSIGRTVAFKDESKGVANIQITLSPYIAKVDGLAGTLHSYIPDAQIDILNLEKKQTLLYRVAKKLGYEQLLYLDLGVDRFDIYKVTSSDTFHQKIEWSNKRVLAESIADSRVAALSTIDTKQEQIRNNWANFVYNPVFVVTNSKLRDIVRAFTTIQLMSMVERDKSLTHDYGIKKGEKSLLVVSGDMIHSLKKKEMVIALLDGLQLRGSFDLLMDPYQSTMALGSRYAQGVNSDDYIVSKHQIFNKMMRVYIPEIPGKGSEKKAVFIGEIMEDIEVLNDIYALSNEFTYIDIPLDKVNSKLKFRGDFVKGAYVEGVDAVDEVIENDTTILNQIIIDGRFKPVVYGPDYRNNQSKLSEWLK